MLPDSPEREKDRGKEVRADEIVAEFLDSTYIRYREKEIKDALV